MSLSATQWISPEEYLEFERAAEAKHEYLDGAIYAMAGASLQHAEIVTNTLVSLLPQLRGSPNRVLISNMRVKVSDTGLYTYPDILVVGGGAQLEDDHRDTLLNPTVIGEVLSPSTEAYDRGDKFAQYRRLCSLREYLLISQDRCRVEQYVRAGEEWVLTEFTGPDARVPLESIGCALPLAEVYEQVEFPPHVPLWQPYGTP
jgi:Uma2 family endonuclease